MIRGSMSPWRISCKPEVREPSSADQLSFRLEICPLNVSDWFAIAPKYRPPSDAAEISAAESCSYVGLMLDASLTVIPIESASI